MTPMRHRYTSNVVLLLVLAQVAVLAWNCLRNRAEGQGLERRAHMLAKLAVNEGNWRLAEVAPLHRAVGNWAKRRGISWERQALRHSDRVYDRRRTDCRRWVAFLRLDARRPQHWPKHRYCRPERGPHPPWRNFRQRWLDVLAEARRVVRDNPNPCDAEPLTWGDDTDLARYLRENPRAVVVRCGDTRNHYVRPGPREAS